jgi:hypothetical protein
MRVLSNAGFSLQECEQDQLCSRSSNYFVISRRVLLVSPNCDEVSNRISASHFKQFEYLYTTRLIMMRVPLLAERVFLPQHFDVQLGSHYYINFPLWQIIVAGLLAFVVGFAWMLGRASGRADR